MLEEYYGKVLEKTEIYRKFSKRFCSSLTLEMYEETYAAGTEIFK